MLGIVREWSVYFVLLCVASSPPVWTAVASAEEPLEPDPVVQAEEVVVSATPIDLRTLLPWDKERVLESVRKTGKALVLHEDTLTGGIGGEISATIMEECFTDLDAPVMRVASIDTAVPFSHALEEQFLPKARLREALGKLVGY